jgi:hypothetical protein
MRLESIKTTLAILRKQKMDTLIQHQNEFLSEKNRAKNNSTQILNNKDIVSNSGSSNNNNNNNTSLKALLHSNIDKFTEYIFRIDQFQSLFYTNQTTQSTEKLQQPLLSAKKKKKQPSDGKLGGSSVTSLSMTSEGIAEDGNDGDSSGNSAGDDGKGGENDSKNSKSGSLDGLLFDSDDESIVAKKHEQTNITAKEAINKSQQTQSTTKNEPQIVEQKTSSVPTKTTQGKSPVVNKTTQTVVKTPQKKSDDFDINNVDLDDFA